jgi:hypothetical protein
MNSAQFKILSNAVEGALRQHNYKFRDAMVTEQGPQPGGRIDQILDWLTTYERLLSFGDDGQITFKGHDLADHLAFLLTEEDARTFFGVEAA